VRSLNGSALRTMKPFSCGVGATRISPFLSLSLAGSGSGIGRMSRSGLDRRADYRVPVEQRKPAGQVRASSVVIHSQTRARHATRVVRYDTQEVAPPNDDGFGVACDPTVVIDHGCPVSGPSRTLLTRCLVLCDLPHEVVRDQLATAFERVEQRAACPSREISGMEASTSTMGRRRRSAPASWRAFFPTRSPCTSASKAAADRRTASGP
jgi:hypothetical protein